MTWQPELEASPEPAAKLAEIEARLKQFISPFRTERRNNSWLQKSSIRVKRAACCASSRIWRHRCAWLAQLRLV